jgi:thiamine transport system permease protein
LPRLKKSLITAFCVSSILSASDLVIISFFGTNDLSTLTQTIYRLMGSYRINEAYSVSLILLIFCFIYFFLAHKILEKNKWNIH